MRTIRPARVINSRALCLLKQNAILCNDEATLLSTAYTSYLRHRGRPDSVASIGIPKSLVEKLDELYRTKRKRDGLNWIAKYRKAEGLSHCPLCGNVGPTQLEHYLPRSPYAEFTVFSWNLLPSCGACNSKRGNHANAEGQAIPLIHPYFDGEIYDEPMLTTKIKRPFEGVRFEPTAIESFEPDILIRIKRQIDACIDLDRFHEYLVGKWNVWRGKAKDYKNLARLSEELECELRNSVGPLGANSWDVAFLRGVLNDNEALCWLAANPETTAGYTPFR